MFVIVRENAFGEDKVLEFCGRMYSEVWQGKLRVGVASYKPVYMSYLNLVVKRLRWINCLNPWANNCTTFWNQKLCRGTVFLHKNDNMKALQVPSLKHSIRKDMFFCLVQIEIIFIGQWRSPPPSSLFLATCLQAYQQSYHQI